MKNPKVSVIIPNYNDLENLEYCLNSVLKCQYPNKEIIVVDDNSNDESVDYIKGKFPETTVIKRSERGGSAKAYNAGIKSSEGKYIAILNSDMEVESDWLKELVRVIEGEKEIAVVDSKYRDYVNRRELDNISAAGRFLDKYGKVHPRGAGKKDSGQYDFQYPVFAGLALFRKSVLEKVGLFDEDYFYGFEDIDLCWRILLAGYKILFAPSSVIYHKGGESVKGFERKIAPRIYFHIKKNRIQTLIKNQKLSLLPKSLFPLLMEYAAYFIYWLCKKDSEMAENIVSSVYWNLKSLGSVCEKRLKIQEKLSTKKGRRLTGKLMIDSPLGLDFLDVLRNIL